MNMKTKLELIGDNEYDNNVISATVSINDYVTVVDKDTESDEVKLVWIEDDIEQNEAEQVEKLFQQNENEIKQIIV